MKTRNPSTASDVEKDEPKASNKKILYSTLHNEAIQKIYSSQQSLAPRGEQPDYPQAVPKEATLSPNKFLRKQSTKISGFDQNDEDAESQIKVLSSSLAPLPTAQILSNNLEVLVNSSKPRKLRALKADEKAKKGTTERSGILNPGSFAKKQNFGFANLATL